MSALPRTGGRFTRAGLNNWFNATYYGRFERVNEVFTSRSIPFRGNVMFTSFDMARASCSCSMVSPIFNWLLSTKSYTDKI